MNDSYAELHDAPVEAALHEAGVQVAGIQAARLPGPLEKGGRFAHMCRTGGRPGLSAGNLDTHTWVTNDLFRRSRCWSRPSLTG